MRKRHNKNRVDLNRQFRGEAQAEIFLIKKIAKKQGPYQVILDLHEDGSAPGAYLYEFTCLKISPFKGNKIFDGYPEHLTPIDLKGNHTYFQKAIKDESLNLLYIK